AGCEHTLARAAFLRLVLDSGYHREFQVHLEEFACKRYLILSFFFQDTDCARDEVRVRMVGEFIEEIVVPGRKNRAYPVSKIGLCVNHSSMQILFQESSRESAQRFLAAKCPGE